MEEKEPTTKEMNASLKNLTGKVDNLTDNLNDLTGFLREHMVTHEDLDKALNKQKHEILDLVDKKIADLKGELVSLMRKAGNQIKELVGVLRNKEALTEKETDNLLSLTPFPR